MASRYKLRCSLIGHEKDVRAVSPAFFPENSFVSGSRDVTTRLWVPDESSLGYREGHCMSGHNNFVFCVTVMPPDDKYPQGLIVSGSNDKSILCFTLDSPKPVFKLEGHSDTVCALSAGKFGSLLSGSWDMTAKVWLNQKCVMTLSGHSAAVWAVVVMPEAGRMLTGSADKTIRMWKAGKCEKTFTGHTDCVRGLAVLSTAEFLSCSNDSSVRRWLTTGECTQTYYGHTNFIYSIAALPNGEDFITGGEDRNLKIWKGGECTQSIVHPAQSIWSVCCLPNGDIVSGGSDGVIRIFSCAPERMADEGMQKAFEEEVASSSIPAQIGDVKTDELMGPEALLNPGRTDGQTLMIRDGNVIQAHQWNAAESRWVSIGEVVGGSGGSQSASGKQLYQGKEYDYVFDVELQEGEPALKLPFNVNEDPWMAAHNFLERNDISQMFLDQVAKFIMDQTKGVTLGQQSTGVGDPFTGGSRYVPGTAGDAGAGTGGVDPFTGAGRYIPGTDPNTRATNTQGIAYGADPLTGGSSHRPAFAQQDGGKSANPYFPKTSFLTFDNANMTAILGKIKEFNQAAGSVQDADIEELEGLATGRASTCEKPLATLSTLLRWPADTVFPVLDVLRLAVRYEATNSHMFSAQLAQSTLDLLTSFLSSDSKAANKMLCLRTLCNAFSCKPGLGILSAERSRVAEMLQGCVGTQNKNIDIALSSLLLNYSVLHHSSSDEDAKVQCLSAVSEMVGSVSDPEAIFRCLVCMATLVAGSDTCAQFAKSLGLQQFVTNCTSRTDPKKIPECAGHLAALLN